MFKVGDKLRCIQPDIGHHYLDKDEIYTVRLTSDCDTVLLEEHRRYGSMWWACYRFVYAKLTNEERTKQRLEKLNG